MSKKASKIRFKTRLLRSAAAKRSTWTFLVLPVKASAELPTRSMTTVKGSLNGCPFQATLSPDGERSHWLKVPKKLRESAGAEVGDMVTLEITTVEKEPEPKVTAAFTESPRCCSEGIGVVVQHHTCRP